MLLYLQKWRKHCAHWGVHIIISTTLKSENPVAHRCQHPLPLECFISSAFCKHSLSLLASPARISRQRQTRRPRLYFSFSAKCLHQRQQQQEEAAAAGGGGSSSKEEEEAAAAAGGSSSSRRQQQQQEAAAAAGGSSSSSKQAESKQKAATSVCPVERIMKYNISFINQRNTKIELVLGAQPQNNEIVQLLKVVVMPNLNFFQAHGLPIQLLRADTT